MIECFDWRVPRHSEVCRRHMTFARCAIMAMIFIAIDGHPMYIALEQIPCYGLASMNFSTMIHIIMIFSYVIHGNCGHQVLCVPFDEVMDLKLAALPSLFLSELLNDEKLRVAFFETRPFRQFQCQNSPINQILLLLLCFRTHSNLIYYFSGPTILRYVWDMDPRHSCYD